MNGNLRATPPLQPGAALMEPSAQAEAPTAGPGAPPPPAPGVAAPPPAAPPLATQAQQRQPTASEPAAGPPPQHPPSYQQQQERRRGSQLATGSPLLPVPPPLPHRHGAVHGLGFAFNSAHPPALDPWIIPMVTVAIEDVPPPLAPPPDGYQQQPQQQQQRQQQASGPGPASPISVAAAAEAANNSGSTGGSGGGANGTAPAASAQQAQQQQALPPPHPAGTRMAVYDSSGVLLASSERLEEPWQVAHDHQLKLHLWDSGDSWWLLLPEPHLAQAFQSETLPPPAARQPWRHGVASAPSLAALLAMPRAACCQLPCTSWPCRSCAVVLCCTLC